MTVEVRDGDRLIELETALRRSDAMLSLLRFRAERSIPWGDVGYPELREVDGVIAQSRAALAALEGRVT